MSRLLQHMKKSDCAILTAFRKQFSKSQNRERNQHLLYDLHKEGHGPIKIIGTYDEEIMDGNTPTGTYQRVEEEGWFVPELMGEHGESDYILHLGNKYDQDSVLFTIHPEVKTEAVLKRSNSIEAILRKTNGDTISSEVIPLGPLTLERIGSIYSQIGKRKFSFSEKEETSEDTAFINMMLPNGLANAYAKRKFLSDHKKYS